MLPLPVLISEFWPVSTPINPGSFVDFWRHEMLLQRPGPDPPVEVDGSGSPAAAETQVPGLPAFETAHLSPGSSLPTQVEPFVEVHPAGECVRAGGSVTFRARFGGVPEPTLQWFRNGSPLTDSVRIQGATAETLTLAEAQTADAGEYYAEARNNAGFARTRAAHLVVSLARPGTVDFRNYLSGVLDAPVFDEDGVTRLAGEAYWAQLYAGPTAEDLQPVGEIVPFRTGAAAGYFKSGDSSRSIPTVPAGAVACVQVRVWERAYGESFETARSNGAKVGGSIVLFVKTGNDGAPPGLPSLLTGLESFRVDRAPAFAGALGATALVSMGLPFSDAAAPAAKLRLSDAHRLADGRFAVRVSADGALDCVVETSSDLRHWSAAARVRTARGSLWLIDEAAEKHPQRFYRARPAR